MLSFYAKLVVSQSQRLSISSALCAGQRWRIKNGLPTHRNDYGPLTDLPDWSYVDGTPGKLGSGQIKRLKKNEEVTEKILRSISELDLAVGLSAQHSQMENINPIRSSSLKMKCDKSIGEYRGKTS